MLELKLDLSSDRLNPFAFEVQFRLGETLGGSYQACCLVVNNKCCRLKYSTTSQKAICISFRASLLLTKAEECKLGTMRLLE